MARPLKFGEEMALRQFRFPKSLISRMEVTARERKMSVSDLVRAAIEGEIEEKCTAAKAA